MRISDWSSDVCSSDLTIVVEDVFVPENRVVHAARSFNYVEPGKKHYGAPSDFFAQMALVHRTMTGVPLGAAEGFLPTISAAAQVQPLVVTVYIDRSSCRAGR